MNDTWKGKPSIGEKYEMIEKEKRKRKRKCLDQKTDFLLFIQYVLILFGFIKTKQLHIYTEEIQHINTNVIGDS